MPSTHRLRKARNKAEARLAAKQGPATADQTTAPIADALAAYHRDDRLTFGIPAHGAGRGEADVAEWAGHEVLKADAPMSHGVDTRNHVWQVEETAQQLFAEAVGAQQTLFSTNGSSMSVHVALLTLGAPDQEVVLARNGHKSVIAGLVLSGARPVWVPAVYDEELELAHTVDADAFEAALRAHPEAAGGMVFTPSYYGTTADVRRLADACHALGKPLVTDDAWGLDYALSGHPDLPKGALEQGSDLAIGSVHKTLSGLSQTSVLSVGSDRIDTERLELCFELEQSTSASALLLSSIDGARRQFVRDGERLLAQAVDAAMELRRRVADEVPELNVVTPEELLARPGVHEVDPTHVLIEVAPVGLTGYEADDFLRDHHQVDVELSDHRRIVPLVTFAHGPQEVDRLVRGLRDMVDREGGAPSHGRLPALPRHLPEQAVRPRDAFFAPTEDVKPKDAVGRVAAEFVTPYPPGIPAFVPGEVLSEETVDYLEEVVAQDGYVEGAADPSLMTFRVMA
ncbi:aminotransferase class I/II-fold pyridoxal phosphate-dependent enzyme [Conexibacter sp. SYSU D00693]|uniref:aminotransferase class I/II-fold pyridoxal phosphate-dependent enzyme n=1 Tax=Conexibacter sp. SYSU D00693 TaxID=2812560 RepID=UPI0027392C0B|nr:DegT/DnrJ/EryC1/StrS family aminotransferase [Conexibacter sp. SYSU D00693]